MPQKEINPIKVMNIAILILLVGIIAVMLFAKQTTSSGEKVGYFGMKKADAPDAPETTTPATTTTTA